ncbi:hypothetical protein PJF56_01935 [Roseofilum sp. BLCC_M91]|uniref:Uncharacterized protein n=1 Tax=Roseofilum halophilum BLCC-M91 TaxID=3022259 RepID=A0ABT7BEK3_9CYAN|nr:hypothetical protein [Roseofilum halophilum]MDJ1177614.1 hypothetical protein [Roseofilum halophilum BLCC-M91]
MIESANELPVKEIFVLPVDEVLRVVSAIATQLGLSVPPVVEMDYLRSLPPDRFGYAWAKHLDDHNLKPFLEGLRRQQLHDGVHVLTGYNTDTALRAVMRYSSNNEQTNFLNVSD